VWFWAALAVLTGLMIAIATLMRPNLETYKSESKAITHAWVSRWEILEHGKEKISANLEELQEIGDTYFQTIFHKSPDEMNVSEIPATLRHRAKILPLMSVMRFLTAREDAYINMPIGIPVKSNQITSLYGHRQDVMGFETTFHSGIDFAGGVGMPIFATADGVVAEAVGDVTNDLGKNIRIQHKYGIMTAYAHMNELAVAKDRKVKRGDLIGFVGTTGKSTGPHVHYEVRIKSPDAETWFELTYNPMPFIREKL